MAITNAQQYQQLVNKPANGKRPGYRGRATDQKTTDAATQSFNVAEAAANVGKASTAPAVSYSGSGGDGGYDFVEQKFDLTPEDRTIITSGGGSRYTPPPTEFEKFIQDSADYPFYVPFYVKKAAEFNRIPNRKFLVERVLKGPNAKRIIEDALGVATDYDDLTEKDLEKIMDSYMPSRLAGEIDAMGNVIPDTLRGDRDEPILLPDATGIMSQASETTDQGTDDDESEFYRRFRADGGIMNPDIIGGAGDGNIDEMGRQMYFVGKLVKKATRAVKKIAKSPIGKAALIAGGGYLLGGGTVFGKALPGLSTSGGFAFRNIMPNLLGVAGSGEFGGTKGILGNLGLTKGFGSAMPTAIGGILGSSLIAGMLTPEQEEEAQRISDETGIDIAEIRANPDKYLGRRFKAGGGLMRLGYQEGGDAEPVAKKTMPLLDMDGKEKDYRETGGFVDMGRMERADDVPARLSKNEFVFTADAVRNAGDGSVDKGAEVMYNMMKNLEAGGEVSEESQGLKGARKMFQTSQRLEEVI